MSSRNAKTNALDDALPQSSRAAPHLKAANDEVAANEDTKSHKRPLRMALMAIVPLALVIGGGWVWLTGGRYEETDNAYAQQTQVSISSDVSGRILSVGVKENQSVAAGDTLFTLDPEPFQIAVDQAQSALSKVRLDVEQLKVGYQTATATLKSARDTLRIQQELYDRRAILADKGVTSSNSLDELKLSLVQAQSAVTMAEKQVDNARAALGGNPDIKTDAHPLVRQALADLHLAERNLEKTTVKAPTDGVINQIGTVNVGQYVKAGSEMATLFEVNDTWVDANYKETQLTHMRVGMPAKVEFDAYPDVTFAAHVASISSGTGAEFALIPAQNATGNWVKVVQRVPVRIEFDDLTTKDGQPLRSGLSANVSIDTGATTLDRF